MHISVFSYTFVAEMIQKTERNMKKSLVLLLLALLTLSAGAKSIYSLKVKEVRADGTDEQRGRSRKEGTEIALKTVLD